MIISDLTHLEYLVKNEIVEGGYIPEINIGTNVAVTTQVSNIVNAGIFGGKPKIESFINANIFQSNNF